MAEHDAAYYERHFADRAPASKVDGLIAPMDPHGDEYQRRYERTGLDPAGVMGPRACWQAGHVPGCPCKAGGDVELREGWVSIDQGDGTVVEVEVA